MPYRQTILKISMIFMYCTFSQILTRFKQLLKALQCPMTFVRVLTLVRSNSCFVLPSKAKFAKILICNGSEESCKLAIGNTKAQLFGWPMAILLAVTNLKSSSIFMRNGNYYTGICEQFAPAWQITYSKCK